MHNTTDSDGLRLPYADGDPSDAEVIGAAGAIIRGLLDDSEGRGSWEGLARQWLEQRANRGA